MDWLILDHILLPCLNLMILLNLLLLLLLLFPPVLFPHSPTWLVTSVEQIHSVLVQCVGTWCLDRRAISLAVFSYQEYKWYPDHHRKSPDRQREPSTSHDIVLRYSELDGRVAAIPKWRIIIVASFLVFAIVVRK